MKFVVEYLKTGYKSVKGINLGNVNRLNDGKKINFIKKSNDLYQIGATFRIVSNVTGVEGGTYRIVSFLR